MHAQQKKYIKNDGMFIIRLEVEEISAKAQKHQRFYTTVNSVIKSSFSMEVKVVGDIT